MLPLLISLLPVIAHCFDMRQVTVTPSDTTINTAVEYTFQFDRRTLNSGFPTAYLSEAVPSNADLTVTFPTSYTLTTPTCLSVTVDSTPVTSGFNCNAVDRTITFTGIFTSVVNLNVGLVVVRVGNIMNPSPAITTGTFDGTIGTDTAVAQDNTVTLTAGPLSGCSVTFNPTQVQNTNSQMQIRLTPTNTIPADATLTIKFPQASYINDLTSQAISFSGATSCTRITTNINEGLVCSGNDGTFTITVSNLLPNQMTVPAEIALGVNSFRSPPSNQPSDSIVLTLRQTTGAIDTCTVFPTGLTPTNFNSFAVAPFGTMSVNSIVPITLTMNLSMQINQDDQFEVVFPGTTSFSYTNIIGSSPGTYGVSINGQTVLMTQQNTPATFAVDSNYLLNMFNMQAPPSTATTDPLTAQVLRNGYPIMTGSATLTATAASLASQISVAVADTVVWANTTYTFTLNTANALSSSGMIRITFPSTLTPSSGNPNCATVTGTNLAINPTCTLNTAGNYVQLSNINDSSSDIPAQNNITIAIQGVVNPPDTTTTGSFTLQTFYGSSETTIVGSGTASGVTPTEGTISIATVSVLPSSFVALQSGVTYTVTFTNTYEIPAGGMVTLQVPLDIGIIIGSFPTYCKLSLNGGAFINPTCSGTTNTSYEFNYSIPAASAPVAAGSTIALQIDTLATNPTNTRIVTGFGLRTRSSSAAIQQLSNGITVQMTTPATFGVNTVTRSSNQNSALASYTVTLRQEAAMPSGSLLFVTLPSQLEMQSSTCTDLSSNALNCTLTSLVALQVTLNSAVSSNTDFGVIISNIKNPPSYRPIANSFVFTTKTSDEISTYATVTTLQALANSLPSAFAQIDYTFNPSQYSTAQTLTLSVTPSASITPNFMLVQLASSFTPSTLTCSSYVGFTGTCADNGGGMVNISGTLGLSQMNFSISGFTSPSSAPSDFTIVSSFDDGGFLIDQNSNTVLYSIDCVIPCKSCSPTDNTSCLSCYSDTSITTQIYFYSVNNSCLADCPDGYYISGGSCAVCSGTCLTCSVTSTNCTSCNTSSATPLFSSGSCLASCLSGQYNSSNECTACVLPCLTCTDQFSCLTCAETFNSEQMFFFNNSCYAFGSCPAGTTIPNNSTLPYVCQACQAQCATCTGTVGTCATCATTAAFHNGSCVTQCPFPLVIESGSCVSCDASCRTCSSVTTNCTSCFSNSSTPFLSTTSAFLGSCVATCPQFTYGNLAEGACSACSSLSIGCNDCASATTCNSCDSGGVLFNNDCLSSTPAGYLNSSGVAVACDSDCSTCENFTFACTGCKNLSLSGTSCVSTCPSGQVSVALVCTSCDAAVFCRTCHGTTTNCTSCLTTATPPVYLRNNVCGQTCPNFTYANTSTATCDNCQSPCELCTSLSVCVTCASGFFLFNSSCSNTCPSNHYVPLDKECQPCTGNCLTCSGTTSNCLSCNNGTYLYAPSATCDTTCPDGLFGNLTSGECGGCESPCSVCSVTTSNCTSCISGKFFLTNQCLDTCPAEGFYALGSNCQTCHSNCTICSSALVCSACATNFFLSLSSCLDSCPSNTPIINANGHCSSCTDTNCQSCNATDFCSQCIYPTLLFNGACLTTCPTDFAPDTNLTTCIYSPDNTTTTNNTNTTALEESLTTTSVFPVPFTIAATFLAVASLMSKFQFQRTQLSAALYGFWGFLEWGAVLFFLVYYTVQKQDTDLLAFYLVLGGAGFLYLLNLVFLPIQAVVLGRDKHFEAWLEGTANSCSHCLFTILGAFTTGKVKMLMFCKLFNFRALSAKMDSISGLGVFHAYGFVSFICSACFIGGSIILIKDGKIGDQLFMAKVDVLVLSVLALIMALCNSRKDDDYFEDIDDDGMVMNKRIEIYDEALHGQIMPEYSEISHQSHLYRPLDSAKKIYAANFSVSQTSSLDFFDQPSMRDISIQAESVLGDKSLISRLKTEQISNLSMFQKQDISIQMDEEKPMQDVSISMSHQQPSKMDVSVGHSIMKQDVSVDQTRNMKDASISPSLHVADAAVDPREVILHDVSIAQTDKSLNEVSVQYSKASKNQVSIQHSRMHEEISVQYTNRLEDASMQMSSISKHEMSIQNGPVLVDETVHMSREEDERGIQCNAQNQSISIQYSAKPLFLEHEGDLEDDFSFKGENSHQMPSDLEIQERMMRNQPAAPEAGMEEELEIDIVEKLNRIDREAREAEIQRRRLERQMAVKAFHKKMNQSIEEEGNNINGYFNNSNDNKPSSLMDSSEAANAIYPPKQASEQDHSMPVSEQDYVAMVRHSQTQDLQLHSSQDQAGEEIKNEDHPEIRTTLTPPRREPVPEIPPLAPAVPIQSPSQAQAFRDGRQFSQNQSQIRNNETLRDFSEPEEDSININSDQPEIEAQFHRARPVEALPPPTMPFEPRPSARPTQPLPEPRADNNHTEKQKKSKKNFETINKVIDRQQEEPEEELLEQEQFQSMEFKESRSTGLGSKMLPRPVNRGRGRQKHESKELQSSVGQMGDLSSGMEGVHHRSKKRLYKKEDIERADRTSLPQYLNAKKREYSSHNIGAHRLMAEDDALTKELERDEVRQMPLAAPKNQIYVSHESRPASSKRSRDYSGQLNFGDNQRIPQMLVEAEDELTHQIESRFEMREHTLVPTGIRSSSRSNRNQHNSRRPPGYLRDTNSSEKRKKSLEKVYMPKPPGRR